MSVFTKIRFYTVRLILLSLFLSFYLIMIADNADRIEEYFDPLKPFKPTITRIEKGLYVGGYPNGSDLKQLKEKRGIRRVICLLDPNFLVIRELVANERKNCKELNIEFVLVASHDFKRYRDMLPVIREILTEEKKTTYIHAYFMNHRLERLSTALSYGERQNLEMLDK